MHHVLGHKVGETIMPLKLIRGVCASQDEVERNVLATLASEYVPFNGLLGKSSGPVSIVGSGPSLKRTYQNLVGDVIACNGAHDFLIERGIVPRFCMMFDAHEHMSDFVTPDPNVTYLIASRCHRSVFEKLKDSRVVVWHAKGDPCLDGLLADAGRMEPMLHGGSAAVTRTLFLAHAMGWKEVHLFGADSSFEDDEHHVGRTLVPEDEMRVWAGGGWFRTTAWMAGQVEDFKLMAPDLTWLGMQIVLHGDGLLPAIARIMGYEVRGLNGIDTPARIIEITPEEAAALAAKFNIQPTEEQCPAQ